MTKFFVGIDIGTLYVKIIVLDQRGEIIQKIYQAHQGNPVKTVKEKLKSFSLSSEYEFGFTGSGAKLVTSQLSIEPIDLIRAEILGVKKFFPLVRNIINIGGGSATLILLNKDGAFKNYITNSLCAAGTGSFLDQQATRLGITYKEMEGFGLVKDPPHIATRCSVFAKSDLIHRQQEGHAKDAMWSGLCRGMVSTMIQTLLKGKPLQGLTVLTGGVSQNSEILRWLKARFGDKITTYKEACFSAAYGAAEIVKLEKGKNKIDFNKLLDKEPINLTKDSLRPPLILKRSKYPDFKVMDSYIDDMGTEVRISNFPSSTAVSLYLGIDIGSTSTKAVLLDANFPSHKRGTDGVMADVYRKTAGDPIGATKLLFKAILEISKKYNTKIKIVGCGTTGSGRKLVGRVINADCIINEITAHVKGAMKIDPQIDTIFEIGGQDSKYMHTVHGNIFNSNMNYVCAAGTGSFIEEQAQKLGFSLEKIGDTVMNITPPSTSDRCTVFMEQDVAKLIRQGYSREEAMAAVLYSVVQNYLNKVVGNRYYSKKKIFFQGATARNKGLVAAFENLLNTEMVVSPFCHQMGAFGVALLCQEIMRKKGEKTKFFGLDLAEREIKLTNKECELCQNHCRITYAHIKGLDIVPSWGYMCGREPDEEKVRHRKGFELYRLRERLLNTTGKLGLASQDSPVIALPRILTMYTYLPMWESFFSLLGFRTKLSKITGEKEKEIGAELSGADFCFPIKAAHGHVYQLIMDPKIDFVFLPYMISETLKQETTGEHFCPYVQSFPGAMKSALNLNKIDCFKLLSPVIDFRWSETRFLEELAKYLCPILGLTPLMVYEAFRKARKIQKKFLKECEQKGKNALEELKKENKKGIVIIGRPYNTYDLGLCINLPQRIADLGYTIVPLDFIPVSQQKIGDEFRNMYWNYGQKIIKALKYIREEDTLFAVYFTNFSCGPDSFILNYAERIMKDKPMLIIELDEHGADAGYITRIEAFSDVIKEYKPKKSCFTFRYPSVASSELKGRKIWIPPMHPIGSRLFASAFKGYGYEAEALPQEDRDAFELGRSLTRGSECLPTSVTLGALVKKIKEEDGKPQNYAFFMPTAEGPCRFGQYAFLHRIILDELGLKDMIIISPASYNAYQGLPEELRKMLWIGILLGDIIFKFGCKIRPYENIPGTTEQTIEESIRLLEEGFSKKKDIKLLLSKIRAQFEAIPRTREPKPLVGIVGEIYVRCDPFSNEEVVKRIEMYGAEAWLVPVSEWILYTVYSQRWKKYWKKPSAKQGILSRLRSYLKNLYVLTQEHEWYKEAGKLLEDRREPPMGKIIEMGLKYMPVNFEGEAVLTIGRAILFAHSGASLIVNAAPFGCMPGTYSTAIFQEVQETIGVPCVNMFYDGEGGLNDKLETFIANIKNIHR